MSIRFKFRSSVNFDTLEIGDRGSVSVGELRTRILKGKNSQQQQQGFDLVFSDAASGLEFKGDACQISSGSSVIVRRVPAGTLPSAVSPIPDLKKVVVKESQNPRPTNAPVDEFDDLGADLCPVLNSNFPDFDLEFSNNDVMDNERNPVAGLRLELKMHAPTDQIIPRGCDQSVNGKNILPRIDQPIKSNKVSTPNFPAEQFTNLPGDMKCPLCNNFFKDAVMIPCCQHSFCQNCIRDVLIKEGRCPKCISTKCSVEHLLPNLSLRQAVEHFLEAQMLDAGFENNTMQKYVPDGESGIQAKEFSCALSVVQKDLELPRSSSATGKGSNQVYTEALYDQQRQRNVPFVSSGIRDAQSNFPPQKVNQIDIIGGYPHHNGMQLGHGDVMPSADFQGENQPVIPLANAQYEGEFNAKRQGGFWNNSGGGDRNFPGPGGHRKGVRNCYTCGSPDHLMRDCPMSHPNPMYPPGNGAFHGGMQGYPPPYWNGGSMPPFRPYGNMYGNPAMMQYNTPMPPPFAAPPYYLPTGGGPPGPGGNTRMGNMGPSGQPEHFALQHCENKSKHPSEDLEREDISDEVDENSPNFHRSPEKGDHHRTPKEGKQSLTRSDDSFGRRSRGRSPHRGKPYSHGERSNSGREDVSRSSEGRHNHHHGESKRYHNDRSESSYGHHQDNKRRDEPDRGSYRGHRERDHTRKEKRRNNGFDEEEYRYHKRKGH